MEVERCVIGKEIIRSKIQSTGTPVAPYGYFTTGYEFIFFIVQLQAMTKGFRALIVGRIEDGCRGLTTCLVSCTVK